MSALSRMTMNVHGCQLVELPDQRATRRISVRSASVTASSVNCRTWRVRRKARRTRSAAAREVGSGSLTIGV